MKIFMKLKSWQLFIILAAPIIYIIRHPVYVDIFGYYIAGMILGVVYYFWVWTIAIESNRRLKKDLKKKTALLSIGIFIVFINAAYYLYFIAKSEFPIVPHMPIWMAILQIVVSIWTAYILYFSAKQLVALEMQRKVSFHEVGKTLFLLLAFPIGVWIIQPKVNNLLVEKNA